MGRSGTLFWWTEISRWNSVPDRFPPEDAARPVPSLFPNYTWFSTNTWYLPQKELSVMSSNHTLFTKLALLLVMVGALALAGCGGGDDGVRVETVTETVTETVIETVIETVEVPDASGIEGVQQKAAAAAAVAKMASGNAAAAAKTAMDATANIATMQTGGMSGMMAYEAKKAADGAMKAYMAAKTASEAAAAATTTEAATEARVMAEAAQKNAEKYAMMATEKSEDAVKYAAMELMIVGKDKNVGESMLNDGAGMTTDTDDDDNKTITGRLDGMDPMHMMAENREAAYGEQDNPNTATDEARTPMVAVEARSVTIGRTLDSSDDMARLMLVTHYPGSKTVKVFSEFAGLNISTAVAVAADADMWISNAAGGVLIEDAVPGTPPTPAKFATPRPIGTYYLVPGVPDVDGKLLGTIGSPPADPATRKTPDDVLGDTAMPETVYTFKVPAASATDPDETRYVVLESSETTTGGDTANTYRRVGTMIELPPVGGADEIRLPAKDVNVMAKLPDAKAYEHLHFGVWANLGEAKKNGSQELDDLGIGFVQNFSGMGMTEVMPNRGSATYNGNWAATVQEENKGAIRLQHGAAMLTANIDKSTLEADLMGLAVLAGDLTGSTFSGTKATVGTNKHGLTASGTFTGTFEGGFYGDGAVEAGGIFDFTSADIADGAFRGAFGGRVMDDN